MSNFMKNKQKILLEIVVLLSISLCACGKEQKSTNSSSNQQTEEKKIKSEYKKMDKLRKLSIVKIVNSNGFDKYTNKYIFTTDDKGIFNLKLQGKQNGKITIYVDPKDKEKNISDFQSRTINIKQGQIITIPLTLKKGDISTSTFYIRNTNNEGQQILTLIPSASIS